MTTDDLRGVPAVEFIAAEYGITPDQVRRTTDDLRTRAREAAEWLYPEPQYDSLTYPHGAVRGYMRVAFIKGALWHAAQQPTRDDISDAIEHSGIAIGTTDAEMAADAVLALLGGGRS